MIAAVAFAVMCHVSLPPGLLHKYHLGPTAVWTGTIGDRPATCCLVDAIIPRDVPDGRIIGRCQVTHFQGRRRLNVSYMGSVIGGDSVIKGAICRQRHMRCCKLAGMAAAGSYPTTMAGTYTCPHETGAFTLTQQ